MHVIRAGPDALGSLAPLFDAYRRFYGQPGDLRAAEAFLAARIANGESVIYLAVERAPPCRARGFVQLYPVFSSVAGCRSWLLNDLYVDAAARRRGVGRALMMAARRLAEETGADGLSLETAADNRRAQRLYESLGYRRDTEFYRYFLPVGNGDLADDARDETPL
jgi:ribosomal protein S18 acetylase RimI-like enzyme